MPHGIGEVIFKSGFNNRGTFFKLFQQRFGCTPKQFRESNMSSAKSDLGIS
ncbi:MAG: helix-turn-helix domain-containing protein [Muribaculaceae bacterium]